MSTVLGIVLLLGTLALSSSIEEGDREFARIDYQRAQAIYDSVLISSSDSVNALWRLARVYVCIADVAPPDQKLELYRSAEAFAYRCIQADSAKSEGHTWRAAALGNIAMFEGGKTKVKLCTVIRQELNSSLLLNPMTTLRILFLALFTWRWGM